MQSAPNKLNENREKKSERQNEEEEKVHFVIFCSHFIFDFVVFVFRRFSHVFVSSTFCTRVRVRTSLRVFVFSVVLFTVAYRIRSMRSEAQHTNDDDC